MPICSLSQLTASACTITPAARSTRGEAFHLVPRKIEEKNATPEVPMSRSAISFDRSRLVFPDSRRKPNRAGTQGVENALRTAPGGGEPQPPKRHREPRSPLDLYMLI